MARPDPIDQDPGSELTRRDFVRAAVGAGFAAAGMPVAAQTIHTDAQGLEAGPVSVSAGSFKVPAYRAVPRGRKGAPVMLVVSEIFGVHEHIADVCRRFAKQGYLAIAPELFVRQGDVKNVADVSRISSDIVAKVPDAQVMGDLDAVAAWAKAQGGDTGKLGITGFGWGGRIVWLYSAHNPGVQAGAAWYGRLAGTPNPLQPENPIDIAGKLHAPVLGLYGGRDNSIPPDTVERMKGALAQGSAASRASQFVVYPDAGHGFNADYRPSYVRDAAQDGWQRCLAWFKQHQVA